MANGFDGSFTQAWVADKDGHSADGLATVSIDGFMRREKIESLTILHADIQGAEADMLRGATQALSLEKIDYIFVSTHSNDVHTECLGLLISHGYAIAADLDLDDTCSVDGLIVAVRAGLSQNPLPTPTPKRAYFRQ